MEVLPRPGLLILRAVVWGLAGALFGLLLSIRIIFVALLPVLALYWFYRNRDRRLVAQELLLFEGTGDFIPTSVSPDGSLRRCATSTSSPG